MKKVLCANIPGGKGSSLAKTTISLVLGVLVVVVTEGGGSANLEYIKIRVRRLAAKQRILQLKLLKDNTSENT